MATNTPNTAARELHTQQTHYLRKRIAFDDVGLTGIVGILPAGAIVLRGNLYFTTGFNTGTLNVGVQGGDADEFVSAAVMTSAILAFDDLAIGNAYRAADTVVTYARSTTQSSGVGYIVIEYIPDNDH